MNHELFSAAKKIINEHFEILDTKKFIEGKNEADPYLIGLALLHGSIIITMESKSKPNKIPKIAEHYNITSFDLFDFFRDRSLKVVKI